ncbi:DUF3108 domain-containing protein [Hydrogenophaga sp. IBVHS1]|uniref:DUF3108 domain-containing protein n=1 Tax=unclassified Hydrogenophaga TaxID=2610897 RepID=UPI000A2D7D48|nr:DUF3108 domain-containing protein [Hydrogenophaga sp. IBVHS1]OSZ73945.1 hypothetical protein CAP37_00205 [Hydrogenophaga sp. IBVHS1]
MPQAQTSSKTAPRWPALLWIGLCVLALHLWLLTGALPGFTASSAFTPGAETPSVNAAREMPDVSGEEGSSSPVRMSQVRWIVRETAAAPGLISRQQVVSPPPAKASVPVAAAKPLAPRVKAPLPAPAPTPAAEPETASPPMEEAVAVAPSTEPSTVLAQAAAVEPSPALPEPVEPVQPAKAPAGKPLPPAQPPASTRLHYVVAGQIKGFNYNATGTLDWELGGERYSARMEMRMPLLGSRVQTSTGGVGPAGLMPERFADKGRSERAAHFEREQNRIRFSANTPEAELLPGAQDRLSLFLQIAGLLQARPQAYASGDIIDMQVAGTGDAEIWRFKVGEESTLVLPAGELRVRHLVRQPRKEFDSTVEMWLAPDLNHLPVRLKVTQANGDMADQQLSQKP